MTRILALVLTIVVSLSSVVPAFAAEPKPIKGTWVWYQFIDHPVIPVGEVITFVSGIGDNVALQWEQKIGTGKRTYKLDLANVRLYFRTFDISYQYYRNPKIGDVGTITGYRDTEDAVGNYKPDGIVDSISIEQQREWTDTELGIIQAAGEFYQEAVEQNFALLRLRSECAPTEIRFDGQKAVPGPYGGTYFLPKGKAKTKLSTFTKAGTCSREKDETSPEYDLSAGEQFVGGPGWGPNNRLDQFDPENFCQFLTFQRPQWQPKGINFSLDFHCHIYQRTDNKPRAVLPRLGFFEVGLSERPKDGSLFVYWGEEHIKLDLPAGTWVDADVIEVGTTHVFTATLSVYNSKYATLSTNRSMSVEILGLGNPVLSITDKVLGDSDAFKWPSVTLYRVISRDGKAQVQRYAWKS